MQDISPVVGSHDLRLSAWGPYTKRYIGVSHIWDVRTGMRFDLSVFPGLYRRRLDIPNVMWESGYHPWEASPDLSYYSHRHEIVWKDQVYCDVAFCRLDEGAVLLRANLVNRTDEPQSLVLHALASLHFAPVRIYSQETARPSRVELPAGGLWVDGLSYRDLSSAVFDPRATLSPDGQIRGEIREHGFVDAVGLGQGFGRNAGDAVSYRLDPAEPLSDAVLLIRHRVARGESLRLRLSGLADRELTVEGTGGLELLRVPVGAVRCGSGITMTSGGGAELQIDGIALVPSAREAELRFVPVARNPVPERLPAPREQTLVLRYGQVGCCYGLAWQAPSSQVREIICDDLDTFMRAKVHEHVSSTLRGPGTGHYTNVFMRPLTLPPRSDLVLRGLVCAGDEETVRARLAAFDPASPAWEGIAERARARAVDLSPNTAGRAHRFGQERMAATVLTNVVYPVRTRGSWIRHNTPGRWWDCLYTWDSGFIGLGLLELDTARAVDCLNAYVTEPGERDAAFIHHGSPVPTQFYLFHELWNRTQSRGLLEHFFPRLEQYHRFLAGRLGSSTTRTLGSGLIRTWDYFYNSGGWDDYPPQVEVHRKGLDATVTPAANTAHAIRTASFLRMAARALGRDHAEYDEDIRSLSEALQRHAWDAASGYFSYVTHDGSGKPTGVLRHESGANHNMGMDGAAPLIGGTCTAEQEELLVERLMTEGRMWSPFGICAVDRSAPYYRDDGYWNGTVWMPHQWFFWKTLLDLGKADMAYRVAQTALELWSRETESSYNCFEHFVIQTGRGAGWHHFGGLSSPVLAWYAAYHRPGRLTTGLDAWVAELSIARDKRSLVARLELSGQSRHQPVVIATLEEGPAYVASWNGAPVPARERLQGVVEVTLPSGAGSGRLAVGPAEARPSRAP